MFRRSAILLCILILVGVGTAYGQIPSDSVNNTGQSTPDSVDAVSKNSPTDSMDMVKTAIDSLPGIVADTIKTENIPFDVSADSIEAPIDYVAKDSIIYDLIDEKVYLFGEASVTYQTMKLTAPYIILDWANNQITAYTDTNELGVPVGTATFNDGSDDYTAKKIIYNYQTNKGKVFKARTQDGESYILADEVKRNEYEE